LKYSSFLLKGRRGPQKFVCANGGLLLNRTGPIYLFLAAFFAPPFFADFLAAPFFAAAFFPPFLVAISSVCSFLQRFFIPKVYHKMMCLLLSCGLE
jgi:hypothetical protein